ncbi:glutathione S-transferase family protein [Rhodoligotrophos defluvii]|uniref:glutathione S-transferase family protein n=1 Tax=Rhodoligotrophos defluvii TaxID=2561934 RepID=UPI0010C9F0DD|nr:glutathione S-transferase [Rhodoligotrophos defluvii]
MKLYEEGRAPNPRRVRVFLAEKAITVERVQVDINAKEHFTEEMLRLNPIGRLPFLVLDDGRVIAETIAICRYFEELHPEPVLFGRDPFEKAMVEMWQRRVEQRLLDPVAQAFRHTHPKMAPLEQPQIPAWGEANRDKAAWMLDFLNREMEHRPFIAGDRFSVADITALVAVDFMKLAKLALTEQHPHLKDWHDRVSARPSAKA